MAKKLVVPGEFLTIEEEFLAGKNAYENENGSVFSSKIGLAEFDEKEREVSVIEKTKPIQLLDRGSIIIGQVILMKESVAVIQILEAEKAGVKRIPSQSTGSVVISNIKQGYVKSLNEELRLGDIVKAKVAEVTKYSVELILNEPELGVIKAYCINCRKPLGLFDRTLKCNSCGSVESRKISCDYLIKQ